MSLDFVAIDFETANQKRGSVIQIGIAKIRDGEVIKTASSFVMPHPTMQRFDGQNIRIHGIRPGDVAGAPAWPEILERITKFAGTLPLVGHNVSVERSCIVQASEVHGIVPPDFTYFCSLKLSRNEFPNEASHSLRKLSASLGLPDFSHHDAEADAVAAARVLLHVAARRGVTDVDDLRAGFLVTPRLRKAA